jgi:hypothetical protein
MRNGLPSLYKREIEALDYRRGTRHGVRYMRGSMISASGNGLPTRPLVIAGMFRKQFRWGIGETGHGVKSRTSRCTPRGAPVRGSISALVILTRSSFPLPLTLGDKGRAGHAGTRALITWEQFRPTAHSHTPESLLVRLTCGREGTRYFPLLGT